jgi:hypothetical protein
LRQKPTPAEFLSGPVGQNFTREIQYTINKTDAYSWRLHDSCAAWDNRVDQLSANAWDNIADELSGIGLIGINTSSFNQLNETLAKLGILLLHSCEPTDNLLVRFGLPLGYKTLHSITISSIIKT